MAGTRPDFVRIVFVGDTGTGKRALLNRIIFNRFDIPQQQNSIIANKPYRKQCTISSLPCIIEFISTSAQEGTETPLAQNINKADAIILVYSICGLNWHPWHMQNGNERDAFRKNPLDAIRRFHTLIKSVRADDVEDLPIGVLGTMSDAEDVRVVSSQEGKACAEMLGCSLFSECSSKRGGQELHDFLSQIVTQVRERRSTAHARNTLVGPRSPWWKS